MLRSRALGYLALVAIVVAACGGGEAPEQPAAGGAEGGRRFLSIGTAPPGGAFFVVGGALAEVLNEHLGSRGWRVSNEATQGTQESIRRLAAGDLELALANAAITYFAVRGEEGWEKQGVAALMTLAPNVALFLTPAGSGLSRIEDLKGQRVVVGPQGAGFEHFLRPILKTHGVTYDDFEPLYRDQGAAPDLLADGSAAAAFLGGAVPTASITQACSTQDMVFLPFGEVEIEELVTAYPFFDRATIPAGTYRGQNEDFHGLNVGSMQLITSADADEEMVYQVTRTLYEHRQEVADKHPAGKAIRAEIAVRNVGTPFHPGAIRFYREIGIWPEDGQSQGQNQSQSPSQSGP